MTALHLFVGFVGGGLFQVGVSFRKLKLLLGRGLNQNELGWMP